MNKDNRLLKKNLGLHVATTMRDCLLRKPFPIIIMEIAQACLHTMDSRVNPYYG